MMMVMNILIIIILIIFFSWVTQIIDTLRQCRFIIVGEKLSIWVMEYYQLNRNAQLFSIGLNPPDGPLSRRT